jgi:osmotically-inducible protein OsmY
VRLSLQPFGLHQAVRWCRSANVRKRGECLLLYLMLTGTTQTDRAMQRRRCTWRRRRRITTIAGGRMNRSDLEIQKDVAEELRWDPSLEDDDIAVSVRNGVVTLAGYVKSYVDKWRAEQVAGRVKGVKAIANDLEVRLAVGTERTDPDLARAALDALKWNVSVPQDKIKVKVEKGWVTLEGDVDYYYQREAAERSVRYLTGVKGVTNLITVKARATPTDVKQKIKEAFERGAEFDADHITVEVIGNKAILRGTVRSYAEYKDAERAARNAPGITEVENKLVVDPSVFAAA